MKKILIGLLLLITISSTAQYHFVTNSIEEYVYNDASKSYVLLETKSEIAFMRFNKEFTYCKLNSSIGAESFICEFVKAQEGVNAWEYNVIAENGGKYYMIIDLDALDVRFLSIRNSIYYLRRFKIKNIVQNEEN
jgi:hypothetical protein